MAIKIPYTYYPNDSKKTEASRNKAIATTFAGALGVLALLALFVVFLSSLSRLWEGEYQGVIALVLALVVGVGVAILVWFAKGKKEKAALFFFIAYYALTVFIITFTLGIFTGVSELSKWGNPLILIGASAGLAVTIILFIIVRRIKKGSIDIKKLELFFKNKSFTKQKHATNELSYSFCNRCGSKLVPNSVYCNKCGAEVPRRNH